MSEGARAVSSYTDETAEEHRCKEAQKVLGLGDIRLYECPLSYITEETARVMRLVFLLDSTGQLLFEGGWADQPFWLAEAYEIYRSEKGRIAESRD